MFVGVGSVSVFVEDQDRAKDFYVNKLGFELRTDSPLAPGETRRWVAVAPKGAATEIILYKAGDDWVHYKQVVGKSQAITLNVKNINALYDELSKKGVQMTKPATEFWGTFSTLNDSEGNSLIVVEVPMQS